MHRGNPLRYSEGTWKTQYKKVWLRFAPSWCEARSNMCLGINLQFIKTEAANSDGQTGASKSLALCVKCLIWSIKYPNCSLALNLLSQLIVLTVFDGPQSAWSSHIFMHRHTLHESNMDWKCGLKIKSAGANFPQMKNCAQAHMTPVFKTVVLMSLSNFCDLALRGNVSHAKSRQPPTLHATTVKCM